MLLLPMEKWRRKAEDLRSERLSPEEWTLNNMHSLQEALSSKILSMIRSRRGAGSAIRSGNNAAGALPPAKLREATFADFDSVARLKQRCGLPADSIENWQRLWLHNPALAHTAANHPIGWVLDANHEVVGYLGNISLECRFGERTISA